MKKKINLTFALVILLVISIVSFGSVFLLLLMNPAVRFSDREGSAYGTSEKEIDAGNINEVYLNNISMCGIDISTYEGEKIKLIYTDSSKFGVDTQVSDERLDVEISEKRGFIIDIFGRVGRTVKIKLPNTYKGALTIKSDAGSTDIYGDYTDINIDSDAGAIDFKGTADSLIVDCDAGHIDVKAKLGSADIKSDVGAVNLKLEGELKGKYTIESDVGSVDVRLPEDADVFVEVSTDIGSIDNRYKFENIEIDKGSYFRAKNKEGKADLNISTNVGSVDIE